MVPLALPALTPFRVALFLGGLALGPATIVAFHRVHRLAAWLLVPYLAWVSFAAFLNFTLWRLNA